jgi:uncharacterized protein YqhQ
MIALVETLAIGINALLYSANQAAPEDEQLTRRELTITTVLGIALALGLFMVLPTLVVGFLRARVGGVVQANLVEGALRLGLFLGYLLLISRMKDIQRVLQYHGAEHKVINALEAGEDLTVENARRHTVLHRRCGTTFLLYVMVVSILLFSFVGWPSALVRVVARLALMPMVAGVAYEIIRLTATVDRPWLNWLIMPGLLLQRLTTREPDDAQLEVAIAALQAARDGGAPVREGVAP